MNNSYKNINSQEINPINNSNIINTHENQNLFNNYVTRIRRSNGKRIYSDALWHQ